ncbi:hypothetical protein Mal64_30220 [Pseudobythopirellula maris]|uniref:Glycosyl hydrolase-like 10 domain-containing protein n=1 Tax=Pseudobythopirellula maris TaxID=2527991 RepID=A0A5C5ZM20_9BACT|nr:family 10 glycosylhydrolase [Pseudobythopirellula maris]TWT87483.1 hypothetical protein Mal64_30220 [Pseudobythopirellula maris]
MTSLHCTRRHTCALAATGLLLIVSSVGAPAMAAGFADFSGLWINRYEYNGDSVSSIRSRIENAASLGITDVMWQVRGRADAYYDSEHEPWAQGLSESVDPLQVAIDAAHDNGIKLHAWMNTMPLWNSSQLPSDGDHPIYNDDPSFRVTDYYGDLEPSDGYSGSSYARVNHLLPEVHDHINDVVRDLSENYDVDGVHLDYIRWMGPTSSSQGYRPDWYYLPHDDYSHDLFFQATGLDGSSFSNATAYRDWNQSRITDLVASVKQTVDAAEVSTGRTIDLSAAVWNNPDTAEHDYLQDYRSWLEQELVDIAMPMLYLSSSNHDRLFDDYVSRITSIETDSRIVVGLGSYLHDEDGGGPELTVEELQGLYDAGLDGAAFYGYGSFFGTGSLGVARQEAVKDFYESIAPVLVGDYNSDGVVDGADFTVWRDSFTQVGEGLPADGNNDGCVCITDYHLWVQHYGETLADLIAAPAEAAGVPEPATWSLLALAGLVAARRGAARRG